MAKKFPNTNTAKVDSKKIYSSIETDISSYESQRRSFERRWYDNNFFDDGLHFRFLSRKTGKIVDLSNSASQISPKRAIPKASRQIRGVASLLLSLEQAPFVYPERVLKNNFVDPLTGQFDEQAYKFAKKKAKDVAQRTGFWIEKEWGDQEMFDKLTHMMLLTAKHGISYLQLWGDPDEEKIKSKVWDAFEIYHSPSVTEIYDSPSIIKAVPVLISKIKANEKFDEQARMSINPDNKYASSEVKQAYMQARFGQGLDKDNQATLILKEAFIKEYINEENLPRIRKQDNEEDILRDRNTGDMVIRHVFSTSNGTLLDEYVDLPEYPFIDLRFEPGLVYQVPLIERFIPANKSLDIAVGRVEGFTNTMVTGIYQKRKGENYSISNIPGGQVIEYEGLPLQQMNIASVPQFVFQFINLLNSIIEEQGAAASTLNKLPDGVKSGVAIESVKASEYANLKIPTNSYKKCVKNIAERMIEIGADYFLAPQEVVFDERQGEVDYFDIIGERGVKAREGTDLSIPDDAVILKKGTRVRIETESGLGYTVQGKKDTMQQIANYMLQLAEVGYVSQAQIQVMLDKFLEIFQFGSTAEFMEALEEEGVDLNEKNIDQMKVAILEVLKDAGVVGEQALETKVDATKVGVVEALKDLGGASNAGQV